MRRTFWTVSALDGCFPTIEAAREAWRQAGSPRHVGSGVWATEHMREGCTTLRTITLAL